MDAHGLTQIVSAAIISATTSAPIRKGRNSRSGLTPEALRATTSMSDARRPAVITTARSRPIGSVWLRNDANSRNHSLSTRRSGAPLTATLLKCCS